MDWIDLVLLPNEDSLERALGSLDQNGRLAAINSLAEVLGLGVESLELSLLRVLVERARPVALPNSIWSRPVTSSDDPARPIQAHFADLHVQATPERVRAAERLYTQFAEDRAKVPVTPKLLQACGYRCQHCGLAFTNAELLSRGLISPHGDRRRGDKSDPLKPHWSGPIQWRQPQVDHHWPVSLYGDNRASNLRVLCGGCNAGKADYLAVEQTKPFVGLPGRDQMVQASAGISLETFYAQIRRSARCENTGRGARETELTVALRNPRVASVLDNLITVESPGL